MTSLSKYSYGGARKQLLVMGMIYMRDLEILLIKKKKNLSMWITMNE